MQKELAGKWLNSNQIEAVTQLFNSEVLLCFAACNIGSHIKHATPGYHRIGIPINTCKQTGSHWVVLLLELDKQQAWFFDPYGFDETRYSGLPDFISRVLTAFRLGKTNNTSTLIEPTWRNCASLQKDASGCGYWCLYFLKQCADSKFDATTEDYSE
jgi:hypothetical protein